jgi:cytochrome oxidase Cu insertion factor (SCO1/SenC/PrrC family)
MNRALALMALMALTPGSTPMAQEPQKPEMAKMTLKVGDVAPNFTLPSDQGKTVTLSDYRGKQNVFLAVYVLAFTGG